jgi:hypothetical protein
MVVKEVMIVSVAVAALGGGNDASGGDDNDVRGSNETMMWE